MLGFEKVERLIERNVIEAAPLAYMRGRTLNDAFIILDESQNTTVEQMKMFLTRIGFNSRAVITGDITQIDLPKHQKSGLRHSIEVLNKVEEVSFNFFQAKDVVRHPVVARIVEAYEEHEHQLASEKPNARASINKQSQAPMTHNLELDLDLQYAIDDPQLPERENFELWVKTALRDTMAQAELTIRIVDEQESQSLNHSYRGKDRLLTCCLSHLKHRQKLRFPCLEIL